MSKKRNVLATLESTVPMPADVIRKAELTLTHSNVTIQVEESNGQWRYILFIGGRPIGGGVMQDDIELTPVQAAEKIAVLTNAQALAARFGF